VAYCIIIGLDPLDHFSCMTVTKSSLDLSVVLCMLCRRNLLSECFFPFLSSFIVHNIDPKYISFFKEFL